MTLKALFRPSQDSDRENTNFSVTTPLNVKFV